MDNVEVDRFSMNGKALCLLGRDAFLLRAPFAGDVLFEYLQRMLSTGWYDQILRSFHGNGTKRKDTIKGALEVIRIDPKCFQSSEVYQSTLLGVSETSILRFQRHSGVLK